MRFYKFKSIFFVILCICVFMIQNTRVYASEYNFGNSSNEYNIVNQGSSKMKKVPNEPFDLAKQIIPESDEKSNNDYSIDALTPYGPIEILGDADLLSQATGKWDEGGTADGSAVKPFVIKDYLIDTSIPAINIYGTTLFFRIENCLIRNSMDAIVLNNVEHGYIYNCTIEDCLVGITINNTAEYNLVEDCEIEDCGAAILNHRADGNAFFSNVFHNNTVGISIWESTMTQIIENNVTSNDVAIHFTDSFNATINWNIVENNTQYAIRLVNTNVTDIEHNTLHNNSLCGIKLEQSWYSYMYANDISNHTKGIHIYQANANKMYSNYISNSTEKGIHCDSANFMEIVGNHVFDNGKFSPATCQAICQICASGIHLYAAWNNTIEDNHVYHNSRSGIWLEYGNFNNIENNVVYNNNFYGILIDRADLNKISDNSLSDNLVGIQFFDSENNNIEKNLISDNCEGIRLEESDFNAIIDNQILYGEIGISIPCSSDSTDYNEILFNTILQSEYYGITICGSNNLIKCNSIIECERYGVRLTNGPNNVVELNNFIDNYLTGTSQAYDGGSGNGFNCNYWNDWTSPNTDPEDEFVDLPYAIDGSANNEDLNPLVDEITIPENCDCPTDVSPIYIAFLVLGLLFTTIWKLVRKRIKKIKKNN